MIKIIIADDHRIVREGLRRVLEEASDMRVIDEAGNGREAIEKICTNRPDVVLLDVSMPDMDGLDATKQIHTLFPGLPVLILTVHAADQYALRILRAGARGYLSKQTAPDELVDAVRRVHAGQKYLSDDVSKQLAFQLIGDRADFSPVESLSDRELQVLCLIANGAKTSEIGDELCLSVKTISTYRGRVLEKLHLRNNADLTQFAMKNNLVR